MLRATRSRFLQVRIGDVTDSADYWHKKLTEEAEQYGCRMKYTNDPGFGYACEYEQGIYAAGASVNVLRGDRIIRVTAYQWPDAAPSERLALAEQVARNADKNLTAYDDARS